MTLRHITAHLVVFTGLSAVLAVSASGKPCQPHPQVVQAANLMFALRRGISEFKTKYGRLPERLEQLGPNAPADAPSADAAAILPEQLLDTKRYKYERRYERSDTGYRVWLTPVDYKKGCGSLYLDSDGAVRVRWQEGDASPQDPAIEDRLRVPEDWMQKRLVAQFPPEWPRELRSRGVQGEVRLRVVTDKQGRVLKIESEGGPAELVPYAVDCLKKWRYQPLLIDGLPFEAEFDVSVTFRLSRR